MFSERSSSVSSLVSAPTTVSVAPSATSVSVVSAIQVTDFAPAALARPPVSPMTLSMPSGSVGLRTLLVASTEIRRAVTDLF